LIFLAVWISGFTVVNAVPLVSVADSAIAPPAGGGGDSVAPMLSPDGRYVLFTSTANNLALTTNNTPYRGTALPWLNVFLREPGVTTLISVNTASTGGGNGNSIGTGLSRYGLVALFESNASDLVADDTNDCSDVFVRDLITETTHLVSVSTNGGAANGASWDSALTHDGRYVAFVSSANNLVPGDNNGLPDVFLRDLLLNTTVLVSVGAMSPPGVAPSGSSEAPDISPDGRYVAFYSTAINLVPGVASVGELYMRDLVAGTTCWASAHARTELQTIMGTSDALLCNHTISKDGNYLAFRVSPVSSSTLTAGLILRHNCQSGVTDVVNTNANVIYGTDYEERRNLDMTPDGRFVAFVGNTNGTSGSQTCIYVWDALTGVTTLASGDLGPFIEADDICGWPTIDPTGRFVAFLCSGTNHLVTNAPLGAYHLYMRDTLAGGTKLVNKDLNGVPQGLSFTTLSRLVAGGQYVAFEAPDGNLVPGDSNHAEDVFHCDLVTDTITLASARHPSLPSVTPAGPSGGTALSVSADGRFVSFASLADDVTLNDTNRCTDIFVRDVVAGVNYLVDVATNGWSPVTNNSTEAAISADGRYVAFSSTANNLVPGDANNLRDVFVRDLVSGTTTLVSMATNGSSSGNGESYAPVISADGRRVLFQSAANNLAPGVPTSRTNLFYRNLQYATNSPLTLYGVLSASMTPDGRWAAFVGAVGLPVHYLYVWDSQSATRVYTNTTAGLLLVSISPDGSRLAYVTNSTYGSTPQLFVADWAAKTNWLVGALTPPSSYFRTGLRFSADGRFLTYASKTALVPPDTNTTYDVYLYDLQARSNLLVSHAYGLADAANDASDSPDISPDGRFVAYRSTATNLVPGDVNGVGDVFLYDRLTETTTLLSVSRFDGGPADSWSFPPQFTRDGRQIVFQSWASDLASYDFNHSGNVFAYAMFYADIMPGGLPAFGPTLSWPVEAGKTYHVEYLDDLNNTNWQNAAGSVTIVDERGYFTDLAPSAGQRFYRIVAD